MKKGLLAAVAFLLACAGSAMADGQSTPDWDYWVDAGFVNWWLHGAPLPVPLVTTGTPSGIPGVGNGILGQSGTNLVYGDNRLPQSMNQGGQFTVGMWLDYDQNYQVTGNFFMVGTKDVTASIGSDGLGNPLLARPVVDARTNGETVEYISSPNAFAGSLSVNSYSTLLGSDFNVVAVADRFEGGYFNLLTGIRWVELREQLDISQSTQELPNGVSFFQGNPMLYSHYNIDDNFRTHNDFYGGQIGAQAGYTYWKFTFNLSGKLAVGDVVQQAMINGSTSVLDVLGKSYSAQGGLYALPTNIGTHFRNAFAILPTADVSVMIEITSQVHFLVGYNLLYISDVARPGDQIDRNINRTQLPTSQTYNPGLGGPNYPSFAFTGSDFWAQGITVGFSLWF